MQTWNRDEVVETPHSEGHTLVERDRRYPKQPRPARTAVLAITTLEGSGMLGPAAKEETLPDSFVEVNPEIVVPEIARGLERPVKPMVKFLMGSVRKGMTLGSVEVKLTDWPATVLSALRSTVWPPAEPRSTPAKVMVK